MKKDTGYIIGSSELESSMYLFCMEVYVEKRYRLLCMLLSERKVGDWLSIFFV